MLLFMQGLAMGGGDPVAPASPDHYLSIMGVGHSWLLPMLTFLGSVFYGR